MAELHPNQTKLRYGLLRYELILWYWFGFSFLIFVPYLSVFQMKIRAIDLLLVSIFFATSIRIIMVSINTDEYFVTVNRMLFVVISFVLLSQLWPLFGNITLSYHNYSIPVLNVVVPIRRMVLLVIIVVQYLVLRDEEWGKIQRAILNGAVHGGVLTVLWMIFEHVFWTVFKIPVNKIIFGGWLGLDPGHTFLNLVQFNGGSVLRATGFSWSPGLVGPPLLMIAILYLLLPEDMIEEQSVAKSLLLLLGPILSLSRTAIFGVGIFLFLAVLSVLMTKVIQSKDDLLVNMYSRAVIYNISIISLIAGMGFVLAVLYILGNSAGHIGGVIGFILNTINDPAPGVIRHVGYIVYLPSILTYDLYGTLFGYGVYTTGAGVELAAGSLPGIERAAELHHGQWRVEPQIVSILIAGGLPGSLLFLYAYVCTLLQNIRTQLAPRSSIREIKMATFGSIFLSTTFILGLGYGIGGTFFLVILLLIVFWTWNREEERNGPVKFKK